MFACLCWVIYLNFHCHDSDKLIKASVWCTAVTYVKLLLWSVLYQRIHFSFSCLAFSVSNLLVNTLLFGFAHKILDIHHLICLTFEILGRCRERGREGDTGTRVHCKLKHTMTMVSIMLAEMLEVRWRFEMVPAMWSNSDNWPLSWSAFASVLVCNIVTPKGRNLECSCCVPWSDSDWCASLS
jgi:hypothetical protein